MKWIIIALVTIITIVVLWRCGFLAKFLGPWAAWMNWIGYFQ